MKIVLCCVLALLQVLICTLGQGALTMCVRKNGTQRLQWTGAGSCNITEKARCSCGCSEEAECSDESPAKDHSIPTVERTCRLCTDYTLVAMQANVTIEKEGQQRLLELSMVLFPVSFELSSTALSLAKQFHAFELRPHRVDSLATILSSVVIRC